MDNKILINVTHHETRVAVIEKGTLAEIFIERQREAHLAGNIYRGRVARVLPGIQSAFVDIGLDKAAFLFAGDVHEELDGIELDEDQKRRGRPIIQALLREGQEILVQVAKDPIGTKGARVTSQISLPGRFLVYLPLYNHVGVSRKIRDEGERRRLRETVNGLRDEEGGFIIRTVSEGATQDEIAEDMRYLKTLWRNIQQRVAGSGCPASVHSELGLSLKVARDFADLENTEILVDDATEHERINAFLESYAPEALRRLARYERPEPIFRHFGVEMEIDEALKRKVWLKSGGYILIEETEALISVDVNTGKFVGKKNSEDTLLKTNLEAVREIAYQLRLRNIGGLIVIDFIDMSDPANRRKVVEALKAECARDKAQTTILPMSEFGLVEMTRKRTRESLLKQIKEPCVTCEGRGYLKSRETMAAEILRQLRFQLASFTGRAISVACHPLIGDHLYQEEQEAIESIEKASNVRILIRGDRGFHPEEFEIVDAQGG